MGNGRHMLVLVIMLLSTTFTVAQDFYPLPGDTIFYLKDLNPDVIKLDDIGNKATWDISKIDAPFVRRMKVDASSDGEDYAQVKEADLLLRETGNPAVYTSIRNNIVKWWGQTGLYLDGQYITSFFKFTKPLTVNRPNRKLNSTISSQTSAEIIFQSDQIHPYLLKQLPFSADKIKITLQIQRKSQRLGKGNLQFRIVNIPVYKDVVTYAYQAKIYLKTGSYNWVNITDKVPIRNWLADNFEKRYEFYEIDKTFPLCIAGLTAQDELKYVSYHLGKERGFFDLERKYDKPNIFAFPNPSYGYVNFNFNQIQPGKYTLTIYNILGVEQLKKTYTIAWNGTKRLNLMDLPKGNYIFTLTNAAGRKLFTKRLTMLRP